MALSSDVLSELTFSKYQGKMQAAHPLVLKHRKVREVPRDDGSVDYAIDEEHGPIEVKREDIMPLIQAMSEAIVEHFTEHAEVQDVANGALTRNVI